MGLEVRRKVSRHRPSQAPLADDCCVEKPLMCENKQVQSGHCKHPAPQPIISSLSGDKKICLEISTGRRIHCFQNDSECGTIQTQQE